MKTLVFGLLLATPFFAMTAPAQADTLRMGQPFISQSTAESPLPGRGLSMEQVRSRFGEPLRVEGPVGGSSAVRPPITIWVYDEFNVYFEHATSLHSVRHHPLPQTR